jgi:hypothetical protein
MHKQIEKMRSKTLLLLVIWRIIYLSKINQQSVLNQVANIIYLFQKIKVKIVRIVS